MQELNKFSFFETTVFNIVAILKPFTFATKRIANMLQTLSPDKLGTKREELSQLLLFFVFLLRISDGKSIVTVYKPGL